MALSAHRSGVLNVRGPCRFWSKKKKKKKKNSTHFWGKSDVELISLTNLLGGYNGFDSARANGVAAAADFELYNLESAPLDLTSAPAPPMASVVAL